LINYYAFEKAKKKLDCYIIRITIKKNIRRRVYDALNVMVAEEIF